MKKILIILILNLSFSSFPQNAIEFYNSGTLKENLKDYNGAILDYSKAILLNPEYGKAYFNRGLCNSYLQNYLEAIKDYSKSISLNNNLADSYYNRGSAKDDLDDFIGAIADSRPSDIFHTGFALNPNVNIFPEIKLVI